VARKRRSESVTSDATSIPDEWTAKPSRGKAARPSLSAATNFT
jgi:hypothetical protein